MTHRQLVRQVKDRMRGLNLTAYQLHQQLKGKVSKQTVYNFLEHRKEIRTETLLLILDALNLTIKRK